MKMTKVTFPFTAATPFEELQNYYNDLLKKIDVDSPRNRIIIQAKLITTKIDAPEFQSFSPDCREVCRKIKALSEASQIII
ncbi:hypothetical protein [Pseudolactococcus yaeyamensis]